MPSASTTLIVDKTDETHQKSGLLIQKERYATTPQLKVEGAF